MRNQQQLDLLKQGVATTWNTWREEHPVDWATLEEALITPEQLSQASVGRESL